jgi:hypothetical protein
VCDIIFERTVNSSGCALCFTAIGERLAESFFMPCLANTPTSKITKNERTKYQNMENGEKKTLHLFFLIFITPTPRPHHPEICHQREDFGSLLSQKLIFLCFEFKEKKLISGNKFSFFPHRPEIFSFFLRSLQKMW